MKKLMLTLTAFMLVFFVKAQTTPSTRDKDFVMCAAKAGLMEVKLGELAQANGASNEVKSLGQHMVEDHAKAGNELKALAAQKSITVPDALDAKQQKAYDKLAAKHGKDFDKAYSKCMVKDHKKVICKFKKEARKGDDTDLKSWASVTLPTLQHHEMMSKETCKAVKMNNKS